MTQQEFVIKNPKERRSKAQAFCLYAKHLGLYKNKDKAKAFAKKAKTKGQADKMIKTLVKLEEAIRS